MSGEAIQGSRNGCIQVVARGGVEDGKILNVVGAGIGVALVIGTHSSRVDINSEPAVCEDRVFGDGDLFGSRTRVNTRRFRYSYAGGAIECYYIEFNAVFDVEVVY